MNVIFFIRTYRFIRTHRIFRRHRIFKRHRAGLWAGFILFLMMPAPSAYPMQCVGSSIINTIAPSGVDQPSDIAVGPQGNIYLMDGVNHRVVVLSPEGAVRFAFGSKGSRPGMLKNPVGIDVGPKGRVFVADTGNHRVQVFSEEGAFLHGFDVKTFAGEKPADPVDVLALELNDYLFVSDNDNHKIKVFTQDGAYVTQWGGFGEVRGKFRYPGMLAANEFNQVFVVDVLNTRVQKFDPEGNFITQIGTWGVSPGELFKPKGVIVDNDGRIFVSDSFMGCVQVFTDLGGFVGVVCDNGGKREFTTPVGMVFDGKNRLHVVEMRKNRIRVIKLNR